MPAAGQDGFELAEALGRPMMAVVTRNRILRGGAALIDGGQAAQEAYRPGGKSPKRSCSSHLSNSRHTIFS